MKISVSSKTAPVTPNSAMGRRERKSRETREKILHAALQLFAERGFFETTTEQITEAADVGQGTFFNYFPTKQHVLAVLSEIQLRTVHGARAHVESGDTPIQAILHSLVHDLAREPGRSQALTRALFSAFFSNETVRALIAETLAEGRKELTVIMEVGQRRGEIRRDRKPVDLALAFQRGLAGTLLLWAMQSKSSLKSWLEKAFQDFWAGAVARKGSVR
jgi:AcrR family transcriptional regulator